MQVKYRSPVGLDVGRLEFGGSVEPNSNVHSIPTHVLSGTSVAVRAGRRSERSAPRRRGGLLRSRECVRVGSQVCLRDLGPVLARTMKVGVRERHRPSRSKAVWRRTELASLHLKTSWGTGPGRSARELTDGSASWNASTHAGSRRTLTTHEERVRPGNRSEPLPRESESRATLAQRRRSPYRVALTAQVRGQAMSSSANKPRAACTVCARRPLTAINAVT